MWIVKSFFNYRTEVCKPSIDKKLTDIEVASHKIRLVLSNDKATLRDLCLSIECVENKDDLKLAFNRLNRIIRILLVAAPSIEYNGKIVEVLRELKCSVKFMYHLKSASTVRQAVINYKTEVTKELVGKIRQTEVLVLQDDSFDEKLISTFFPDTASTISAVGPYVQKQHPDAHITGTKSHYQKASLSSLTCGEFSNDTEDLTTTRQGSAKRRLKENTSPKKRRRCSAASPERRQNNLDYECRLDQCKAFRSGSCRRGRLCKYIHAN